MAKQNWLPAEDKNYTWSNSWVDFDLDGDLDLHVPENRHLREDFFYENLGAANAEGHYFQRIFPSFITGNVESTGVVSWMDYDQDCDPDLFMIKSGRSHPTGMENNRFYHNVLRETGTLGFQRVFTAGLHTTRHFLDTEYAEKTQSHTET